MVRTEVSGKLLDELRSRMPSVGWRVLREEGIASAGCQQVLRVVAESSTFVRIEFSQKALDDQKLERVELLAASATVERTVRVQWRTSHRLDDRARNACPCGRDAADSLADFLHCEPLRLIAGMFDETSVPLDFAAFFGLRPPSCWLP